MIYQFFPAVVYDVMCGHRASHSCSLINRSNHIPWLPDSKIGDGSEVAIMGDDITQGIFAPPQHAPVHTAYMQRIASHQTVCFSLITCLYQQLFRDGQHMQTES